jgi:hypothetical protein
MTSSTSRQPVHVDSEAMRSVESEISVRRSIDSTLRQAAALDGGLAMGRTSGMITAPGDAGASIAD